MASKKPTGPESGRLELKWWITTLIALAAAFVGAFSKLETKADRSQMDQVQRDVVEGRVLTAELKTVVAEHTTALDRLRTQVETALSSQTLGKSTATASQLERTNVSPP
jgi:hypothetical protein